jgi:transcriptional regulator with GAF, ATPase, and Fis domain
MATDLSSLCCWRHCMGTDGAAAIQDVISSLSDAGIVTAELTPDSKFAGPGIVISTEMTPDLYRFVRTVSRNGAKRVLVIVHSGAAAKSSDAWRVLRAGASDLLLWENLSDPTAVVAARLRRWQAVDQLLDSPQVRETLVGESRVWRNVLRQIVEAARFTGDPVLLFGETGTGKELAACLIHDLDPRRSQHELVILDCTTIVPDLSGSELFGHERGAFTGAVAARDGAFSLADKGTLFLDEVGELPLALQVQLLRVLQEHAFKRVGSNVWHKTDFRLVCATNRDLLQDVAQGRFRRDLYYRIASWTFRLPALCERAEDIPALVRHFMKEALPGQAPPDLDQPVRDYFVSRAYPGNVRDLRSLVFRVSCRHVGPGPITIGDVPPEDRQGRDHDPDKKLRIALERPIRHALVLGTKLRDLTYTVKEIAYRVAVDDADGNLQHAARRLGVTDRTLQKWRAEQNDRLLAPSDPSASSSRPAKLESP